MVVFQGNVLVLAAGSCGFESPIPGLPEYGFSSYHLYEAIALDDHLHGLANKPLVRRGIRSSLREPVSLVLRLRLYSQRVYRKS